MRGLAAGLGDGLYFPYIGQHTAFVNLHVYYGNQPLNFWGFPLWAAAVQSIMPMVAGALIYVLRSRVGGPRLAGGCRARGLAPTGTSPATFVPMRVNRPAEGNHHAVAGSHRAKRPRYREPVWSAARGRGGGCEGAVRARAAAAAAVSATLSAAVVTIVTEGSGDAPQAVRSPVPSRSAIDSIMPVSVERPTGAARVDMSIGRRAEPTTVRQATAVNHRQVAASIGDLHLSEKAVQRLGPGRPAGTR